MWKVNINIDDLELRSCDTYLTNKKEHTTLEIVRWNDLNTRTSCYTIAYFIVDLEEWIADLKFVGNRPFEDCIDRDKFWQLAKLGYKILRAKFEREYNE